MDQPFDLFTALLQQNPSGDIDYVRNLDATEERPHIVLAAVYGIVKSDPFGVELAVADHTRKAIFSLKGAAHWKFAEQHMRVYAPNEPIIDPYAMGETWNHNYLFLINPSVQLTVMGHNAFSVIDICMDQPAIDEYAHYVMDVDVYNKFQDAVTKIVPRSTTATNGAMQTATHVATHPNNSVGFKKRVNGPYIL